MNQKSERPTDEKTIKRLLRQRAGELRSDAIDSEGQVPLEQLESVERLSRLERLLQETSARRARWPVAAALALTLVVVSILLFARVGETEIELDLVASEVAFQSTRSQTFTDLLPVSAVGIAGANKIKFPPSLGIDSTAQTIQPDSSDMIRLAAATNGVRTGSVTLGHITLSEGTHVRVASGTTPGFIRLSFEATPMTFRASLAGPVTVSGGGVAHKGIDSPIPTSVVLGADGNLADLDVSARSETLTGFFPALAVVGLSLSRTDEFSDLEQTLIRSVSTILSGDLYLESLKGQQHSLRPGQRLAFREIRGEIRSMLLHEDGIALRFHGYVRGMTTGQGDSRRSLMPTYLEWLHARHGVSLLWGTTLYILGLYVGVRRWWRGEE